MSLNDYNRRARLDISVQITGSGQFYPFSNTSGQPVNWTLNGTVNAVQFVDELTVKEETCGVPFGSEKQFRTFGIQGSVGNNSGVASVGQLPQFPQGLVNFQNRGTWTVNTSPVLSADGNADGDLVVRGYYTVAQPDGAGVDDPIPIDPAIDFLTRVYPGDRVSVSGTGGSSKWVVAPQYRYPKPDRTFFWIPNSSPVLASGGIVDGELALPGTIMLPTATYYIEDEAEAVDGMRYFIAGQGVQFDGQRWTKLTADAFVYEPLSGPREFWVTDVSYNSTDRDAARLENDFANRPFVSTNQTIDDGNPVQITLTYEGGEPETIDLIFRWNGGNNGAPTNIQPAVAVINNFGDAWSTYRLNTRNWLQERIPSAFGAAFRLKTTDPEVYIELYVDEFIDGNVTEISQTVTDPETGNVLTNTYTVTLTATPYIE
jgi:hypothetical protein